HTVGRRQAGNPALQTDRPVALLAILERPFDRLRDRIAVGMSVDHHRLARSAAEQLIERQTGNLPFDVPERGVDRCNGRHSDRTSPPVRPAIEELPEVFDAVRVAADQAWDDVVLQISGDGELAAIQGGKIGRASCRERGWMWGGGVE